MRFRWWPVKSRVLASGAALSLLVSCMAPAKVRRISPDHELKAARPNEMHAIMQHALAAAGDDESAYGLGEFVKLWKRQKMPHQADIAPGEADREGETYRVRFDAREAGVYSLDDFDDISGAYDFEIARLPLYSRPGIGVPLVGTRANRQAQPLDRFYPPELISRPITALATVGACRCGVRPVTIQLLHPARKTTMVCDGKRVPVAADFSVPWAVFLAKAVRQNRTLITDMMSSTPTHEPQLYLMEPYDPQKEPVIMIHGLLSNPMAWASLTNAIWADEAVSKRYQVWHYRYNPSAPTLYSAQLLRQQLRELRQLVDPKGRDAAMRRFTIIGHSMGGLIAKALVADPGDALEKVVFSRPIQQLNLSSQDRAQLEDTFQWQPDRRIHRLILFAVPHQGTPYADSLVGRMGSAITTPPLACQQFFRRVSTANPGAFTTEEKFLGRGRLNGIQSLSPTEPMLRTMAFLPFPAGVKVHSIIGDHGKQGPLEQSSDGFVPYSSSHLDCAESEVVTPANHRSFSHPKAVEEVIRILRL